MLIALPCLLLLVLSVWIRSSSRHRPLDRNEVYRIRRFAEKRQREESSFE